MIRFLSILFCVSIALPVAAETHIVVRDVARGEIVTADDFSTRPGPETGTTIEDVVGKQAKRFVRKGTPLKANDFETVPIVKRNDQVVMKLRFKGMVITTAARALETGGAGDIIRVMNIDSRKTLTALVTGLKQVEVRP